MAAPPPPPTGGGMSLYANLLDSSSSSSANISRAPVSFKPAGAADDKKPPDAALRFQPIRRPQAKPPTKAKGAFLKSASTTAHAPSTTNTAAADPSSRRTLADFALDDDNAIPTYFPEPPKPQRGGRRAKKKQKTREAQRQETDWDEIYDPARPTNVEEYLRSEEKIAEVREWKAILYAHRRRREGRRSRSGSDTDMGSEEEGRGRARAGMGFAPPEQLSFAPPPMEPRKAVVQDDATGDDAYARRMALSGAAPPPPPPPPPPEQPTQPMDEDESMPPPPPPPPEDVPVPPQEGTISRAPVRYEVPPPLPPQAPEDDNIDMDAPSSAPAPSNADPEAPEPKSSRPGQKGFAARLMSKYGWTQGSGLGANESGIVDALRFKVEKRKRKPDSEGGGFVDGGARKGKIIGGTRKGNGATGADARSTTIVGPHRETVAERKTITADRGPVTLNGDALTVGVMKVAEVGDVLKIFPHAEANLVQVVQEDEDEGPGKMSNIVLLQGMLEGMPDLQGEIEDGLAQEIGEECGEKYGRVERLYIDIPTRQVFIKFTDQISALRALNALQGRIFNGNTIVPRFYDPDKFAEGVYS